ncbi:hypothetical protein [Streptomyces echinatus]
MCYPDGEVRTGGCRNCCGGAGRGGTRTRNSVTFCDARGAPQYEEWSHTR